ncbi:hypothetical protein [Formosa sediminum]|nr:hypothetical protein [Formosa sediminum]
MEKILTEVTLFFATVGVKHSSVLELRGEANSELELNNCCV